MNSAVITMVSHDENSTIEETLLNEILSHGLNLTEYSQLAPCYVSVLITNDETIKKYNFLYKSMDKATNVLSFPVTMKGENWELKRPLILGDIILSWPRVIMESTELKNSTIHGYHLLLHGFLHLLHYNHEEDHEAAIMESIESKVMVHYKWPDPHGNE